MAARRVKENTGEELPDSILHHVFTLVPTIDGVRISILSMRWRRVWHSIIPASNFSEMHIHFLARKEHFKKFVDECLKYRELGKRYIDTSITRFSL